MRRSGKKRRISESDGSKRSSTGAPSNPTSRVAVSSDRQSDKPSTSIRSAFSGAVTRCLPNLDFITSDFITGSEYLVVGCDPGLATSGQVILTSRGRILSVLPMKLGTTPKGRAALQHTKGQDLDRRLRLLAEVSHVHLLEAVSRTGLPITMYAIEGISRGYRGRAPDSRSTQAAGALKACAWLAGIPRVYSVGTAELRAALGIPARLKKADRGELVKGRFRPSDITRWESSWNEHTLDALMFALFALITIQEVRESYGA